MAKKENPIEIKRYDPSFKEGLSTFQVNERVENGLVNKSQIKIDVTIFRILAKNLFTFFNILLLTIGIIVISFGLWSSAIFLVILFLNTGLGIYQDIKAKIAVNKLSLIEKRKVSVVRNSKVEEIESDDIVLDDIVLLKKDDVIPCDSYILKGSAMVDESLLTGESVLQNKDILNNKLFSGTTLVSGKCYIRVDKIGEENYINKLQLKSKEYKSPQSKLFFQLNKLFKILGIIVVVLGFFELLEFGLINIFKGEVTFETLYDFLKGNVIGQLAGSLVSMIPSGMYLLISTALAVGVINLAKEKVLVKDMYSQEILARTDVLCFDKTGTITTSNLSVFDIDMIDKKMSKDRLSALIASYSVELGDENYTSICLRNHFSSKEIFKVTDKINFSSAYKYSATTLEEVGTLVIGAYSFFEVDNLDEIKDKVNKASKEGFRVLVIGLSKNPIKNGSLPNKISAIALIYLQDEIRKDIKETIEWFNNNGVSLKVISGDNVLTAYKIAERAGIKDAKNYISLEGMSDEKVKEVAEEFTIFGRVSPEQKEILISSLREKNHTVAMVGDGINDVLSLKKADVAVALESGAKATRDIASFVLVDNNFAKLESVVGQGRRVINNLQRTCSLFLTKTTYSIFLNIFFLIYGLTTSLGSNTVNLWPFKTNNFYAWELFTIGIASFLLALEPNIQVIKGNFLNNVFKKAAPNGIIMGLCIMSIYIVYLINPNLISKGEALNISTIFMSLASFIPLVSASLKLDKYRLGVIIISGILVFLLFLWSHLGEPDWLEIKDATFKDYLIALLATGIYLLLFISYYFIVEFIIKKRVKR